VTDEAQDNESKTDEPTEKKIHDAVERGNVPISREAAVFALLVAMLTIGGFVARRAFGAVAQSLDLVLGNVGGWPLQNGADAVTLWVGVATETVTPLLPIFVLLMVAGLFATCLQSAPRLVLDRLRPKLERISVVGGWRRIFGARGRAELGKSLFKLVAVCFVLAIVAAYELGTVVNAMAAEADAVPDLVLAVTMRLLSAVCIATVLLLAADLVLVRFHWRRDLRMSRQEIKDELKQMERDPLLKARLRSLALDRIRRSMIAAVPRATLVIANPTHYAIALRYKREEGGAPLVLSKGKDLLALKIREIAEQHKIPVVEDKALARSMYDVVDVDRAIPPQFYKALAEIIHFLHARSTHRPPID
jgi:flagellar biosynthetic protein FlhB